MTEEDSETECLATSEQSNKEDDALNTSHVEEGSLLLTDGKEKCLNVDSERQLQIHDGSHYEREPTDDVRKDIIQPKIDKNLYPNVLISGSRDHSDIDTDEEDFQMRNSASHQRNDSGQGSSITDASVNTVTNELRRLDLTDEESVAADSPEASLDNMLVDKVHGSMQSKIFETPTKELCPVDLDENVAEILSKIPGEPDEMLGKSRSANHVKGTKNVSSATTDVNFDENDFTDIPLDSPGAKQNLNTYAPRPGLSGESTTPDSSDDLRKPSVTDTKSKSGFR